MKKIATGVITLLMVCGSAFIVGCASEPATVTAAPAPAPVAAAVNPDDVLVSDVKAAFASDPELRSLPLQVKSAKGEVTISGPVKSGEQIYKAALTAEKIKGVKYVINEMRVVE